MDFTKIGKRIGSHPINKAVGELYDSSASFPCEKICSARDGDEIEYNIFSHWKGSIIIESKKSGQYWLLPITRMVDIAKEEGINDIQEWQPLDP